MIVPPTGHGMLTLCDSVEEYRLRGGKNVHAMAVAGIGGSAIGAAAFARNVADALGQPVAAVVSGYGLGDLVNEAIGGAFLFGWMGHMRSNLEAIDDAVGRPKLGAYGQRAAEASASRRTGLDSDTVSSLLSDKDLEFTFVAGHSRGNRVIADALFALKRTVPERLAALVDTCRVVTFGGRIKMPEAFTEVIDVVGELDWFGELNSRPKIATDLKVPFCGHSTNTDLPGALKVTKIITDILAHDTGRPATSEAASPAPEPEPVALPEPEDMPALLAAEPAPLEPEAELLSQPLADTEETGSLVDEPIAAKAEAQSIAPDSFQPQETVSAAPATEAAETATSDLETEPAATEAKAVEPEIPAEDKPTPAFISPRIRPKPGANRRKR
jgi:hypothetical protein